jgi:peptidoglycan/LPS O-acetylase OafA/YrhL
MILAVHCTVFIGPWYAIEDWLYFGVLAVELFFALSGYLIGTILLKVTERQGFSAPVLLNFWLRRWMRTLPAYYTVAIVLMVLKGGFFWSFLFFLQNYFHDQLAEFPVSWTISLEEWFYLSFPVGLYLAHRLFARRITAEKLYLWTTVLYIVGPPLVRAWLLARGFDGNWDLYVRKSIFIRFDTIGYGLLLAWLHRHHEPLVMAARTRRLAFAAMLGLTMFTWWAYNGSVDLLGDGLNVMNTLVVFPGVNWVCFFAVVFALHFARYRNRTLGLFMTAVSITSYSLYLVHFQIFLFYRRFVETEAQAWGWMAVGVASTALVGFLLNMTVERYFINKRDTWLKSKATSYQQLETPEARPS